MCVLAELNSEIVKLGKCHAFSPTEATMSHPAQDNLSDGVIKHPSHGRRGLGDDKRLHAGVLVLQLPLGTDEYRHLVACATFGWTCGQSQMPNLFLLFDIFCI